MKMQLAIAAICFSFVGSLSSAWGSQAAPEAVQAPAAKAQACADQAPADHVSTAAADSCGENCAPKMIERMILVPRMTMEKRLMQCVEYTTEPRTKTFTVMHAIPEKKSITRQVTVMVPETRTKTENYTVCKPVPSCDGCGPCKYEQETKQREIQYTVCVPHTKEVTCDVTVCRMVPEEKTVTFDACVSHIVQKPVDVPVCHMVYKKIMLPAPTCCSPCCGPSGCGGCW
jgi:YTV protein